MSSPSATDIPTELHANLIRSATTSSDCRFSIVSVMLRPFMAEHPPDHGIAVKAEDQTKSDPKKLKQNNIFATSLDMAPVDAHLSWSHSCNPSSHMRATLRRSAREIGPILGLAKFPGGDILERLGKRGVSSMSSSKTYLRLTPTETKADLTDRAAREIIDAQTMSRDKQIARLRSLRMQSEAIERAAQKAKPALKARKKGG